MSIKVKINNDWVDTNIKAVRGVNHVNSEDVYTKQESDALFSDKVSKTDITQSTGTSTTSVMSQKAISDALSKKADQTNSQQTIRAGVTWTNDIYLGDEAHQISSNNNGDLTYNGDKVMVGATVSNEVSLVQNTGQSTTSVMSQKAVSDAINKLKNAGYLYAGIATPTTNTGTPDGPVFYIATTAGSYSNFGNIEISKGESAIIKWNNGIWTKNTFKPMTDFNSVFDAEGKSLTDKFSNLEQEMNGYELEGEGTHEGSEYFEYHFVPGVSYTLKNIGTIPFNAYTRVTTTSDENIDVIVSGSGITSNNEITFTATGDANYLRIYWFAPNGGKFRIVSESLVGKVSDLEDGQTELREQIEFVQDAFVVPSRTYNDLLHSQEQGHLIGKFKNLNITSTSNTPLPSESLIAGDKVYIIAETDDLTAADMENIYVRNYRPSAAPYSTFKFYFSHQFKNVYFAEITYDIVDGYKFVLTSIIGRPIIIKKLVITKGGLVYSNEESSESGKVRSVFVSPTGSDNADGSEASPYRTFSKAIGDGNVNIIAEPGNYGAETLQLFQKHNINISVRYKETSEYDKIKQNAIIDNSITELVSSDSATGLLKFALSAPTNSNWYKVFVSHTLPPQIAGTQTPTYNVVLWKHFITNEMEDYKLVPVLSLALCQSTQDSFFYDSSAGLVYINSSNSDVQFKRLSLETSTICMLKECINVHIENLTFKYGFEFGFIAEDSSNISLYGCEADHTAVRTNIYGAKGTTMTLNCCKAYKATGDGFGCSDKARLDLINCTGSYNYDDGVSHHRASEGIIVGGTFENNGKGGIATPTYNSVVNIYGAVSKGNKYGILAVSESTMPIATFIANGCVLANNSVAGMLISRYRCLSINNMFFNNATDKQTSESGSIEEFGT